MGKFALLVQNLRKYRLYRLLAGIRPRSLFGKFTVSITAFILLTIGTTGWMLIKNQEHALLSEKYKSARKMIQIMAKLSANHIQQYTFSYLAQNAEILQSKDDEDAEIISVTVYDNNNKKLNLNSAPVPVLHRKNLLILTNDCYFDTSQYSKTRVGKIVIAFSLKSIHKTVAEMRLTFLSALSGSIIILALLIFWLVFWVIIRPIRDMNNSAKRVAAGDFDVELETRMEDEIGVLMDTFNRMTKDLKKLQREHIIKERLKREMELAHTMQALLLPPEFPSKKLQISAGMFPAEMVGGDYYDVIHHRGNYYYFIGDVTGHGLTSGIISIIAQTAFLTTVLNIPGATLPELYASVNRVLYNNVHNRMKDSSFMTFSMLCTSDEEHFRIIGGHEDLLIYRTRQELFEHIKQDALWLNLLPEVDEQSGNVNEFTLEPGDIVLLYSDGLIEAQNEDGHQFELTAVKKIIREFALENAETIRNELLQGVMGFMDKQKDDITLLLLKR